MTRRAFLPAMAAPGAAALAADAPKGNAIIELQMVHLRNTPENQRGRMADHWKNNVVPALQRAGAGPVGVFNSSIAPGGPFLLTLVPYPSLAGLGEVVGKLSSDAQFIKSAQAFDQQPGLSYERIENSLLRAFDGMPNVVPPAGDAQRAAKVFELRIYESNNWTTLQRKIKMFEEGEMAIFKRLGMSPVFFGSTIIGRNMPNLAYMLAYNDMAHRDQCWRAFGSDPEWQKLRAMPGYSDAEIVSNISNYILTPAAGSMIR